LNFRAKVLFIKIHLTAKGLKWGGLQFMDTQIHINYDTAFGEDDEMSQTDIHNALIAYLMSVLSRLFIGRNIGVFTSISLYGAPLSPSRYKSPDLLVIDGLVSNSNQEIGSYTIDADHPAPRLLMEICSEGNWQNDVEADQKPLTYAQMGVPEYFAVDPHIEQIWTGEWLQQGRLIGWRLNTQTHTYDRIPADVNGRLWSEQLNCYLVMEEPYGRTLHLYDTAGQLLLTDEEAERQAKLLAQVQLELESRAKLAERQAKLAAERQAEEERQAKLAAQQQAEEEYQAKLAAQQQLERLKERLRQLDPNFNEADWK
jgi:Uma2 family endonuclease